MIEAPEIGGRGWKAEYSNTGSPPKYSISNVGVYGIVAARTTAHPHRTKWWGSKEGIAKEKAAFGSHDGN